MGKEVRPGNNQIASKNLVNLPDTKLIHRNTLLCTNNERSEREIKKTIPFTITSKSIQYLGKIYLRRQKTCTLKTMRHWWNISKMTQMERYILFLDWRNQYYQNDYAIQANGIFFFFAELKQKNFKFVWKQKIYNTKRNLEGKKNAEVEESGCLTSDYTTKLQ